VYERTLPLIILIEMDFDLNLLLSVIGGLGNRQEQPDGSQVYVRDDDCIGMHCSYSGAIATCMDTVCSLRCKTDFIFIPADSDRVGDVGGCATACL
jgi:hypothetical protein